MLNESELSTLLAMLRAMVERNDPTDLPLLQLLTPDQKAQLWAIAPLSLRQGIHQLARAAA
ncbi:MAG: hypothetical protein MUF49_28455 [Oculatellaceae cyanobacterium Prado106]|jgi:hypothetical protein|nr:hypothetical protein [Oculatellaceae cyanobacterium Prado106]